MELYDNEMLVYVGFFLGINSLLEVELVARFVCRKAFNPFSGQALQFFGALAVFNHNPVVVGVNVGDKDVHGNNTLLYLCREACREDYDCVLFVAVAGTEAATINIARKDGGKGALTEHPVNIALYLFTCLCHTAIS